MKTIDLEVKAGGLFRRAMKLAAMQLIEDAKAEYSPERLMTFGIGVNQACEVLSDLVVAVIDNESPPPKYRALWSAAAEAEVRDILEGVPPERPIPFVPNVPPFTPPGKRSSDATEAQKIQATNLSQRAAKLFAKTLEKNADLLGLFESLLSLAESMP